MIYGYYFIINYLVRFKGKQLFHFQVSYLLPFFPFHVGTRDGESTLHGKHLLPLEQAFSLHPSVVQIGSYESCSFLARLTKSSKSYSTTPGVGLGVGVDGGVGVSKKFNVKVFYVMGKALSGEQSCPCDRSCCKKGSRTGQPNHNLKAVYGISCIYDSDKHIMWHILAT